MLVDSPIASGALWVAIGRLLGKYYIGRVLGEGAFGIVFEARPVGSDSRVALKQIRKQGVGRDEVLRGVRERRDEGRESFRCCPRCCCCSSCSDCRV